MTAQPSRSIRPGTIQPSPFLGLFLRRRNALTEALEEALRGVPVERRVLEDGDTVMPAGPVPRYSCLLIRGMAMRCHPAPGGDLVVSALCVPGDFMDLHAYLLDNLDHSTVAVGRTVVEYVGHAELDRLVEAFPEVTKAFWRETLVDAKTHRAWVVAGASLRAPQRVAHLLSEIEMRLARVGLSDGGHFTMPLDQKRIAEILGLSPVHVNRVVQELRGAGLLHWRGRALHLPNRPALHEFASFEPSYLDC